MNSTVRRSNLWLPFMLVFMLSLSTESLAGSSVYVDPLLDIFVFEEGEAHRGEFAVSNPGNDVKIIELSLVDFVLDEQGAVNLLDAESLLPYSMVPYVALDPQTFSLAPGARRIVQYTAVSTGDRVPHWGGILIRQRDEEEQPTGSFVQHLETQFLFAMVQLSISGCPGEPSQVSVYESSWSNGILTVRVLLTNQSDCIARSNGMLELFNQNGQSVGTGVSSTFTVLPHSVRIVPVRIALDSPEAGTYEVRYTFTPSFGDVEVGQLPMTLDDTGSSVDSPGREAD